MKITHKKMYRAIFKFNGGYQYDCSIPLNLNELCEKAFNMMFAHNFHDVTVFDMDTLEELVTIENDD